MSPTLVLDYDGEQVAFDADSETTWGDDRVLAEENDDLVASRPWADDGFTIAPFLDRTDFETLTRGLPRLVDFADARFNAFDRNRQVARREVNIHAPLAGSSTRSSLPLVPGRHRWRQSEIERTASGAQVNGDTGPPVVGGAARPLTLVRPDPALNEVLVFSSYLIHGGAFNQQTDQTRVSLEMHFWRSSQATRTRKAGH